MKTSLFYLAAALLLSLLLTGCGGLQQQVLVPIEAGEQSVAVKAESFSFEPNNLKVKRADTLVLRIENVSGMDHNFSLTDPDGRIIRDVPLPAGETVEVKVEPKTAGIYRFYCSKLFHGSMGMQGRVVVIE